VEDLAKIFSELVNQKKKYHEKTLSIEAEDTLVWRFLSIYDFTLDISSLLIPEFYYTTMSLSLLFDFDLYELEPLNLEFEWRFPTIDEWLKGVSIVIEKLTPEELAIVFPELAVSVEEFISANIKEEYAPSLEVTRPEKCYWGVSRYGECYVDPRAVREFIRTTMALAVKKHPNIVHRRLLLESLANTLNFNIGVARYIHDRMAMVMGIHTDCFVLDYSVLDVSRLCEQYELDPTMGVAHYVNIDNQVVSVAFKNLADAQYGCILDVTPLDFCFLMPEEDIYKHSPEYYVFSLEEKLRRFRDRLMLSPLAITNYVTGDEAADYSRCERTEIWGYLMALRYTVETIVKSWLDNNVPNIDIYTRRKYVTAVLQLVGHLGKRHKWGYRIFRVMSDEELKSWWIDYWGRQGLDRDVLEKLWNFVAPLIPSIVTTKLELGRRPRKHRLGTVIS
jgi:hypothetical protein